MTDREQQMSRNNEAIFARCQGNITLNLKFHTDPNCYSRIEGKINII